MEDAQPSRGFASFWGGGVAAICGVCKLLGALQLFRGGCNRLRGLQSLGGGCNHLEGVLAIQGVCSLLGDLQHFGRRGGSCSHLDSLQPCRGLCNHLEGLRPFGGVRNHPGALQPSGVCDRFGGLRPFGGFGAILGWGGLQPSSSICSLQTRGRDTRVTSQRRRLGNGFQRQVPASPRPHPAAAHPRKSPALDQPSWGPDFPHLSRSGGIRASISLCLTVPEAFLPVDNSLFSFFSITVSRLETRLEAFGSGLWRIWGWKLRKKKKKEGASSLLLFCVWHW